MVGRLEAIATFLKALRDSFHDAPQAQQEPSYEKIASLDLAAQKDCVVLFYKANKFADAKEIILALISKGSMLTALWLLGQAIHVL